MSVIARGSEPWRLNLFSIVRGRYEAGRELQSSRARLNLVQLSAEFTARRFQLEALLQVDPDIRRGAEIATKAQGRIGGDAALLVGDIVHACWRHTDRTGERVAGQLQRKHEFLAQNLARVNRRQEFGGHDFGCLRRQW